MRNKDFIEVHIQLKPEKENTAYHTFLTLMAYVINEDVFTQITHYKDDRREIATAIFSDLMLQNIYYKKDKLTIISLMRDGKIILKEQIYSSSSYDKIEDFLIDISREVYEEEWYLRQTKREAV